jgi:DNA-binding NarL/FixJ family response regulator
VISPALVKITPAAAPASTLISMPASLNHNLINLNSTSMSAFLQMNACLYPAVFGPNVAYAGVPRRHWELLRLVAAGHTNAQIACRLGVSDGTVRIDLQNVYARLHVSSRTAAVTRAFPDLAAM